MHSARILKLLVAALSASTASQAFIIDAAILGRHGKELLFRQDSGANNAADASGNANTVAATSTPADTTSQTTTATTETTAAPTTSDTPTTTSETTTAPAQTTTTSDDAAPTTSTTSQNAPTQTTSDAQSPSATDSKTTSADASSTTASATPVTSTTVVVETASDGSVSSSTSVSVSTPTPNLSQAGSGNGSSSGMSTQTRNTIIGVVVGVGGAIVLAVAGIFAWRIWGRNRHNEENDGLMGYNNGAEGKSEVGGLGPAASTSAGARSPFTDTLESYHGPTAKPNTAANF